MFELLVAIAIVESGLNPSPRSDPGPAGEIGILQITPICVEDVNRILKVRKSKRRYDLVDRHSVRKSFEMFRIYITHYRGKPPVEADRLRDWQRDAARTWNGGPKYLHSRECARNTWRYWGLVKKELESQNDA